MTKTRLSKAVFKYKKHSATKRKLDLICVSSPIPTYNLVPYSVPVSSFFSPLSSSSLSPNHNPTHVPVTPVHVSSVPFTNPDPTSVPVSSVPAPALNPAPAPVPSPSPVPCLSIFHIPKVWLDDRYFQFTAGIEYIDFLASVYPYKCSDYDLFLMKLCYDDKKDRFIKNLTLESLRWAYDYAKQFFEKDGEENPTDPDIEAFGVLEMPVSFGITERYIVRDVLAAFNGVQPNGHIWNLEIRYASRLEQHLYAVYQQKLTSSPH